MDTKANVLDAEQHRMIIGDKYEMYTPIAQMSSAKIGLVWHDAVDYSFTYAGSVFMGDTEYVATADVHYLDWAVPKGVTPELWALLMTKGTPVPLCPVYIAAKFIRPVTS